MGKVVAKVVVLVCLSVLVFIYTLYISVPSYKARIKIETIPILSEQEVSQYDTIHFEHNDSDYIKSLSLLGHVNNVRNIVLINKDNQRVFASLIDATVVKDFNSGISEDEKLWVISDTLQYEHIDEIDMSPYMLKSGIVSGKKYVFNIMANAPDDSVKAFDGEILYLKGLADYRLVSIDVWG